MNVEHTQGYGNFVIEVLAEGQRSFLAHIKTTRVQTRTVDFNSASFFDVPEQACVEAMRLMQTCPLNTTMWLCGISSFSSIRGSFSYYRRLYVLRWGLVEGRDQYIPTIPSEKKG